MIPGRFRGQFRRDGFTLIELLIVIAIILILIAIALPNFLEAQLRARTTSADAEMRGIALALESYRTDWPRYPPQTAYEKTQFNPIAATGNGNVYSLMQLTTPIRYMERVPLDLFAPQNGDTLYKGNGDPQPIHPSDAAHGLTYLYWSQESLRNSFDMGNRQTADNMKINGVNYTLLGVGPDRDLDTININGEDFSRVRIKAVPWAYSATNGTKSSGDLLRSQA